jgi:divalent metal cation (Fe/Co/Zn/Cd) transporter
MSNASNRTVWVAFVAGLGVTLSKVGAAIVTSSPAMAAEASHSLADNGNDLFLLIAQHRSARPRDEQHPFGYGREAYFWALLAALGAFIVGAAFSLREGITQTRVEAHLSRRRCVRRYRTRRVNSWHTR